MASDGFWNNQEKAQATVGRLKSLTAIVRPLDEALAADDDLQAMVDMADEDESFAAEVPDEVDRLEKQVDQLELSSLLSGTHDAAVALLTINARDGGTDANDWAEMLLRMYCQWAQKGGYSIELLDRNDNPEHDVKQ